MSDLDVIEWTISRMIYIGAGLFGLWVLVSLVREARKGWKRRNRYIRVKDAPTKDAMRQTTTRAVP